MEAAWKGAVAQAEREAEQRLEVALCAAWHVAGFNSAAKVGKLESWEIYRAKVFKKSSAAPKQENWRAQKLARQEQMQQLKRHLKQRQAGVRRTGVHDQSRRVQGTRKRAPQVT